MRFASAGILTLGTALLASAVLAADPQPADGEAAIARPAIDPDIVTFVETYCSECHNDFVEEGDRSFDGFIADPDDAAHDYLVAEMLDQLNHGTMPKQRPGENVLMPSDDERRLAVASLTGHLSALAALDDPAETLLRRLTNVEYRNTMRDLLGVNPVASEAAMSLPADQRVHGLENLAAEQSISLQLMSSYVLAAQEYLDAAFAPVIDPLPAATRRKFAPIELEEGIYPRKEKFTMINAATWTNLARDHSYIDFGTGFVTGDRPFLPKPLMNKGGVPADGVYTIRVEVEAVHRENPYKDVPATQIEEALKLAIGFAPDNQQVKVVHSPSRTTLNIFDVADNQRQTFEVKALMRKGNVPLIYCVNCVRGTRVISRVIESHYPEMLAFINERRTFETDEDGKRAQPILDFLELEYKGPRLRIYSMQVEGPYPEPQPEAFTSADFARFATAPRAQLGDVFVEFASRAFRRPVSQAEIAPFLNFTKAELDGGASQIDALKTGFAAILASPQFLFLDEGNSETGRSLDNYQLATRLSYFLWSTLPDRELRELAAAGALTDPKILRAQVARMVADERASAFITGFTRAWLRLDKLGSMPPDQRVHPLYFAARLEPAMRQETELVFAEVLRRNLDPRTFLDSDFTYLNDGLARHYRMDGDFGENFSRVALSADSPRRGLIGHASILTASANGIDTSPVIRGVWVLDNLLGTPPPAPPPDVPAIEPDARGATTIRELLEKHRSVQACRDCHANLDPYGFPLEVFGPTGELRSRYPKEVDGKVRLDRGLPVESDTVLPSGLAIADLATFRQHLRGRDENFMRHLVEKLLSYGTGREPTIHDRAEIEAILSQSSQQQSGFADVLARVIVSDYFRQR